LLEIFFLAAFLLSVFFPGGFFLAVAFFLATLRVTFFLGTFIFFATGFRDLDVVFFREGFFLAAICLNPDGDKITAALYICAPDIKALIVTVCRESCRYGAAAAIRAWQA
jgi:hypothetical protein